MKLFNLKTFLSASAIFAATFAYCQDLGQGVATMGFGDVAAIKQKAEAGDAMAQVALADSLASRFQATEALLWYRKAAVQGNVGGQYYLGQMLLFGHAGIPANLSVAANPTEGILWTFKAATNHHAYAILA